MKKLILFLLIMMTPWLAISEPPEGMVLVPAGEFTMGTDDQNAPDDQRPARKIDVDAFYIDKHEVTNAQFKEFIQADGYDKREYWTKDGWNFIQKKRFYYSYPTKKTYRIEKPLGFGDNVVSKAPDHPVIGISWYEASAYAKWVGKRLPTEAEWEKAARGNDSRIYPWGNDFDVSKLNYFPTHNKLSPVGSFPEGASPYGVLDMAGNVAEWCADNTHGKDTKAIRGGGWNSMRLHLTSVHHEAQLPTHRSYTLGFRCAKSVKDRGN